MAVTSFLIERPCRSGHSSRRGQFAPDRRHVRSPDGPKQLRIPGEGVTCVRTLTLDGRHVQCGQRLLQVLQPGSLARHCNTFHLCTNQTSCLEHPRPTIHQPLSIIHPPLPQDSRVQPLLILDSHCLQVPHQNIGRELSLGSLPAKFGWETLVFYIYQVRNRNFDECDRTMLNVRKRYSTRVFSTVRASASPRMEMNAAVSPRMKASPSWEREY